MGKETIKCPHCGSENISKNGHNKKGKQRYNCKNKECKKRTFILDYEKKGYDPKVRQQVLILATEGTGTRATGRILGISKDTVTAILKKQKIGR